MFIKRIYFPDNILPKKAQNPNQNKTQPQTKTQNKTKTLEETQASSI